MNLKTKFSPTLQAKFVNEDLWNKILNLNLNLIYDRLVIKHGWEKERATDAIDGYRKFLYITNMYGKPVSPTQDVDFVWHEHILHTNKYAMDCQKLFGAFLHHFPTPSQWKENKSADANCSHPCCNHKDCCNDNPSKSKVTQTCINKLASITMADCDGDGPAPGGCAPIGGSDTYCSGTTNTRMAGKFIDFDNPDINEVSKSEFFLDVANVFFAN